MAIDTKHEDLRSLRIDRSQRSDSGGEPPAWARRYILGGVAVVVLLGLITLAYRAFSSDVPEVEVVRAAAETRGDDAGGIVLSATGYIVAHHTINVNSKVTGRLAWIGVEKGDKVKEGQVLVRLEDQEFRASYEQYGDSRDGSDSSASSNLPGLLRRSSQKSCIGETIFSLSIFRAEQAIATTYWPFPAPSELTRTDSNNMATPNCRPREKSSSIALLRASLQAQGSRSPYVGEGWSMYGHWLAV